MQQKIKDVVPGGIGEELGLEAGDILLSIDEQPIEDVLDYYFLVNGEYITLQILTKDGEMAECEVEKEEDEDLGLIFEDQFMYQMIVGFLNPENGSCMTAEAFVPLTSWTLITFSS